MTPEQVRQIIKEELEALIKSDRYVFHKRIQMLDKVDIETSPTTGTKIGTASTQKISLWGNTPVTQRAAIADGFTGGAGSAGGGFVNATERDATIDSLNDVIQALRDVGIIDT